MIKFSLDQTAHVRAGDRRALARLLTAIENDHPDAERALIELFPDTGHAWIIGITGAPGTGKSTLVSALAKAYRTHEKTIAIIAVDPTSPFTGGAILGDRIRMRDLSGDAGIFIRSMATRGSLGGLAKATRDSVRALDAAGFDLILVETVGAGQSEVDIARMAHTTLVVEAPGLGDDVQAIKAGILEIADVLVVNKADRAGVNVTVRALKTMLELGHPSARTALVSHHGHMTEVKPHTLEMNGSPLWIPPIVQTVANHDKGIDELIGAIDSHRTFLNEQSAREQVERRQIEIELSERLREQVIKQLMAAIPADNFGEIVGRVQTRQLAPQEAVRIILEAAEKRGS